MRFLNYSRLSAVSPRKYLGFDQQVKIIDFHRTKVSTEKEETMLRCCNRYNMQCVQQGMAYEKGTCFSVNHRKNLSSCQTTALLPVMNSCNPSASLQRTNIPQSIDACPSLSLVFLTLSLSNESSNNKWSFFIPLRELTKTKYNYKTSTAASGLTKTTGNRRRRR